MRQRVTTGSLMPATTCSAHIGLQSDVIQRDRRLRLKSRAASAQREANRAVPLGSGRTPRPSAPKPKTLPALTCHGSLKTISTPSSNAASWPTASGNCAAVTATTTSRTC